MPPTDPIQPAANPVQSAAPTPQSVAPAPAFVGNTNIVDRSGMQAIMADPVTPSFQQPIQATDPYKQATAGMNEAVILICGAGSSAAFIVILYLVKSTWTAIIISSILAIVAIYFAVKNYRINSQMTPTTVIGLSAATITLVYVANALLAQIIIRSAYNSLGY